MATLSIASARAMRDGGIDAMAALNTGLINALVDLPAEDSAELKLTFGRVMGEVILKIINPAIQSFPNWRLMNQPGVPSPELKLPTVAIAMAKRIARSNRRQVLSVRYGSAPAEPAGPGGRRVQSAEVGQQRTVVKAPQPNFALNWTACTLCLLAASNDERYLFYE